ncbi:hypothetical protein GCM10010195_59550 [Kitasatospora griseola]|nr:hypothetical protein GCM10010195_59550 [Kitasatospora griseola]
MILARIELRRRRMGGPLVVLGRCWSPGTSGRGQGAAGCGRGRWGESVGGHGGVREPRAYYFLTFRS